MVMNALTVAARTAMAAGFNELTDLHFKVEQLPAFVDGATFLQAARRAVPFWFAW